MSKSIKFILEPDAALSPTENIFLAGIFIREEVRNNSLVTMEIPRHLFEKLTKPEFNSYFSDLLLEANFQDEKIKIQIKDIDNFILTIN